MPILQERDVRFLYVAMELNDSALNQWSGSLHLKNVDYVQPPHELYSFVISRSSCMSVFDVVRKCA